MKQGKFAEALVQLGNETPRDLLFEPGRQKKARMPATSNGFGKSNDGYSSAEAVRDSERRFEASMCYLRGICHAKRNAFDQAKSCYKDAVRMDIRCFEAFDQLMRNSLLSPDEEWEFLSSLNFDSVSTAEDISAAQEAGELTKMLYTTRMSKYGHSKDFAHTVETLATHYKLGSNHDILLAKAETQFTKCNFRGTLALTSKILEDDRYNFAVLPVHLACLYELGERNALHLLSEDFTANHPEEPASWLAVGVYYLNIGKIAEARRYFSKASIMDTHFGPAWIGFAHTFAAEGEHDQATSAYTTAARLFQGSHLPQLFLGMQQLQLHNMELAREYLETAKQLCPIDPLVLNEIGVTYYQEDDLVKAIEYFLKALKVSEENGSDSKARLATRSNLAHAYRRANDLDASLAEFDEVLRGGSKDVGIYTTKAMILMDLGQPKEAIQTVHEALALNPQDAQANDLLAKALEEAGSAGGVEDANMDEINHALQFSMQSANHRSSRRKGKGKQPAKVMRNEFDDMDLA